MNNLRKILIERGIPQRVLAEEVNISGSRLSRIKNGLKPSEDEAVRISSALGLTVDDIWEKGKDL